MAVTQQNKEILSKWLHSADEWTKRGSQDAVDHVNHNGNLMQVFDWQFIESKFDQWS